MKFIKGFFAVGFFALLFVGISQYIETSQPANLAASAFCFIVSVLLFRSLFKKKSKISSIETPADIYIESDNIISHSDRETISEDEIPNLIQAGYKNTLKPEQTNPKFQRTTREEELSFQFMMKYGDQVQRMTDSFENAYRAASTADEYSDKIQLYESALSFYQKAKKFCYSKGKGGTIYFQDMWEYMHNSKNPSFSYETLILEAMKETKEIYENLIPAILDTISKNNGILQRDIYRYITNFDKSLVRKVIKQLSSKGKISMEKKGNSYFLTISDEM